ncbi:metal-sulfur cluster assembly factor [bacterium]|nr:metal-sulfur cluster assembly factor [bacterium]
MRKTLQKVYDPEFPLVDMETLGLFYAVDGEKEQKKITITMTFTTPACPMGDLITEMVKNELKKVFTDWDIQIEITFEPLWTPKMIKDQDLQRMFE